ncbi:MAG TPA: DUF4270 family protein [Chitinophagaceae bacterium]|nr:DUF4270 family protein [Chitinophagaceae bacterium]
MKNRYIAISFLAIVTSVAFLFSACRRINEATELGAGLIPPVDGITTFDTSITVQCFNDTFGLATDSQYLSKNEEYFLGRINSDPFFGKTDARIFLELKPAFYKWTFANSNPDSLYIDSVVLVLNYTRTYGDTNTVQTVNVYEMDQSNNFRSDTSYLIRKQYFTYSNLLGTRSFAPRILNDSVKAYRDTNINQMRIRLDNNFGQRLLSYDSSSSPLKGAYANDSAFRSKFKGFAIQSMNTGNAVMGFDLTGFNTKLAIYYRYDKNGRRDTTVNYFLFGSNFCAAANYIKRDYAGTPVEASLGGATPDPVVYVQNTPGTFATIKLPDLGLINNRLIHRAELIMEQVYDISDSTYTAPDLLYLDAADPSITKPYKFRTIPYDLFYNSSGALNLFDFGASPTIITDGAGNKIRTWKFNLSRYVQHVLTRTQSLYDLRVLAPFSLNEQYGIPPSGDVTATIFVNPGTTRGRVRLGGGNHPSQRMRLRLVYSKL